MVKGAPQGKTLTLHSNINIDSQPGFRVGRRYVIIAVSDLGAHSYIPIPIDSDSVAGRQVVQDSRGWPVAEVHEGRIALVAPHVEQRPSIRFHNARDAEGHLIPDSVLQPARPPQDRYWSPGSPVEIIRHEADPGTRVTEAELLAILRSLDGRKPSESRALPTSPPR